MGAFRTRRDQGASSTYTQLGVAHCDGDTLRVVVSSEAPEHDGLVVLACRDGIRSEASKLISESIESASLLSRSSTVGWVRCLSGDEVIHDICTVPAQVRSFDEAVRLDAVLAGSRWGNAAALATSGYNVGHAFRGDQCILAVARQESLVPSEAFVGITAGVTTDAYGLLGLLERVRNDVFDPAAGATLAVCCLSTSVAFCAISDGTVRLLHQASLLGRMKPVVATPDSQGAGSAELEFEFGGSYSLPTGTARVQPLAEARAAEAETSVYQSALLHLIDEVLGLASETEPFSPDTLFVTGEVIHRHAVLAYLRNCFGSSVHADELDVALSVRIDDPALARELAAQQSQFAGALGALAAFSSRTRLVFGHDLNSDSADATAAIGRASRKRFAGVSPALTLAIIVFLVTSVGLVSGRLVFESRRRSDIASQLEIETRRQAELNAISEEWKVAESRLIHARSLLTTINGHRFRQLTPPKLLAALRTILPSDARLMEISFSAGVVKVSGYCEDRDLGPSVALAMEHDRDSFVEVTPRTNTAMMKLPNPESGLDEDTTVHTFSISARYVGGDAR